MQMKKVKTVLTNCDCSRLCLINYEKLKEDIVKELKPCLQFIGFDMSPNKLQCIKEQQEGNHHRRSHYI